MGVYDTVEGRIELGYEGPTVLRNAAQQAHRRYVLRAEPRAKDADSVKLLAEYDVEEGTRRRWLQAEFGGHRHNVALGAGQVSRYLNDMRPDYPPGHIVCQCGVVDPGRVHLTWECPMRTTHHLRDPVAGVERELLQPIVAELRTAPGGSTGRPLEGSHGRRI